MLLRDWNSREVEAATSRRGVTALARVRDGLFDVGVSWPPAAVVQKLYQSRQARAYDLSQLEILTRDLGYYCDLQSVHSEDAITWNFFGTVEDDALPVMNWLTEATGVGTNDSACSISLWRRIPHPDTLVSGGPEIDALVVGDRTVIAVEAKWQSGEGTGQGKARDKSQLQLRNEYFAKYGPQIYGRDRTFVVASLALTPDELALPEPLAPWIRTVGLTWSQLSECSAHPRVDEYARYYQWKVDHSRWTGRRRGFPTTPTVTP